MGPALAAALSPTRGEKASLTPRGSSRLNRGEPGIPVTQLRAARRDSWRLKFITGPHRGAHAAPQEGETALAAGWRHI